MSRSRRKTPIAGITDACIIGAYRIVYRLEGEVAVLLTVFRSSQLFPFDIDDG